MSAQDTSTPTEAPSQGISKHSEEHYNQCIQENERIINEVLKGTNGFWLFGYGSILWKQDFHFSDKLVGYINGYSRRFWQESSDHRGTPSHPGRVCTLVRDVQKVTWGLAFYVPESHKQQVVENLNFREKNGYSVTMEIFNPRDVSRDPFKVLLYVAREDNKCFVRGESLEETAKVIAWAEGPSGKNKEYLFNLVEALKQLQIDNEDDKSHVYALDKIVKDILENNQHKS